METARVKIAPDGEPAADAPSFRFSRPPMRRGAAICGREISLPIRRLRIFAALSHCVLTRPGILDRWNPVAVAQS